jgi:hypothetical protein
MVALAQGALRLFQFLFSLITLALLGNVIANAFSGNPSSVNFAMFVAVLAMLFSIFGLVAAFIESLAIPIALLVIDGLATFFTFVAGVVLAARLGVHSCSNKASP